MTYLLHGSQQGPELSRKKENTQKVCVTESDGRTYSGL